MPQVEINNMQDGTTRKNADNNDSDLPPTIKYRSRPIKPIIAVRHQLGTSSLHRTYPPTSPLAQILEATSYAKSNPNGLRHQRSGLLHPSTVQAFQLCQINWNAREIYWTTLDVASLTAEYRAATAILKPDFSLFEDRWDIGT